VGEVKFTYLVLKKIESSSNDGAGHGGLPLLRFFPSAFLCCLVHRLFCFFSAFLCFLSSWDEGIKKMTMSVLSGDSSFSACLFLVPLYSWLSFFSFRFCDPPPFLGLFLYFYPPLCFLFMSSGSSFFLLLSAFRSLAFIAREQSVSSNHWLQV